MSKALKKLMKEKEEEKVNEKLRELHLSEVKPNMQVKTVNMFAGIQVEDSSSESDNDKDVSKNDNINNTQSNKGKDEVRGVDTDKDDNIKPKKKNKKNKKKKKAVVQKEDDDFIIEEISAHEKTDKPSEIPLLVLNIKNFNYNKELDGYFKGTRLSDKQDVGSNMNKRQRNLLRQHLKQNKPNKKYILAQNEDVIQKLPDKLDLKLLRRSPRFSIFGLEPTARLTTLRETYETVRNTMDPNAIQDFLMLNPYYPEALYDMAEFFRLKGNYKDANYLIEKLLFFYEECLTFEFKVFEDTGVECIFDPNYNNFTNLFFKAIFKFMVILIKKGCYKSALEYAKLLLKLNPLEDPMGSLLMIDHFALSANRLTFLKDFAERFGSYYFNKQTSLLLYPNYVCSYAICLFKLKTKDMEQDLIGSLTADIDKNLVADIFDYKWDSHLENYNFWLTLAVLLYPQLIKAILNITEMHKQNPSHSKFIYNQKKSWVDLFNHELFNRQTSDLKYPFLNVTTDADIAGLEKVFEIYPERNKLIWKQNVYNIWMKAVTGNLVNCIFVDEEKFKRFRDSLVT